jgi:hypothetical protein
LVIELRRIGRFAQRRLRKPDSDSVVKQQSVFVAGPNPVRLLPLWSHDLKEKAARSSVTSNGRLPQSRLAWIQPVAAAQHIAGELPQRVECRQ